VAIKTRDRLQLSETHDDASASLAELAEHFCGCLHTAMKRHETFHPERRHIVVDGSKIPGHFK